MTGLPQNETTTHSSVGGELGLLSGDRGEGSGENQGCESGLHVVGK